MMVLGLTGGIATGKSTVARQLVALGAVHFDADASVHALMQRPEVMAQIAKAFPDVVTQGEVDRKALGAAVFADAAKLATLEAILHPLVREEEFDWLAAQKQAGVALVVLDIPLLFESGADALCDYVLVTDCPPDLQAERALSRAGMTPEKLARILARQMPRHDRLARADTVIETGAGLAHSQAQLSAFLQKVGA